MSRKRGEQGQVSTAILMSFTFVLLTIAMMAIPNFTRAGTERTGLDSAADAAALAGAQQVQEMLPQIVEAYARSGGESPAVGSIGAESAILCRAKWVACCHVSVHTRGRVGERDSEKQ